ncbi:MAG: LysR family transcriptional regulator [Polyangiaceae bacterium]
MVNSEWLQSFVAFAEGMNFTRAAERRHVSQPALHVQIKKLSEALGVTLYVRRGRSLELTVEGRQLLAFGREQQERTGQLLASLREKEAEDRVVLAAGEGTFLHLLPRALRAFQREEKARLSVLTRDREQAVAAVLSGEAHLGVTVVDEVPAGLVARHIARVGAALVMPRSHRLARKRSLSIGALQGERLIVPSSGRPLRSVLARAFADAGVPFAPAVEANGWELMLCFAELGLGLAVVNDFCKPPKGMLMRPLRGLPTLQYQLLKLERRPQSASVRALESAIVNSA